MSWVTTNGPTDNLNELANMLCAKILMQAIEYKDAGAAAGCWEPKDHEGLPLGRRAHGDPHTAIEEFEAKKPSVGPLAVNQDMLCAKLLMQAIEYKIKAKDLVAWVCRAEKRRAAAA